MPERPKLDSQTLKRLLSYMRAYKGTLVLVTICILLSAVAGAASSMFLQKLIDGYIVPMLGTASPDFSGLIRALVTIGCVYLVGTLATWLYNRRMVTIAQGTLKRIRDEMFEKMQRLPIRYFDTHTHGDIMSLYTNDTDTLRQMIAQSMAQLVSSVFTLTVVFFCMLYISVWLTLIVMRSWHSSLCSCAGSPAASAATSWHSRGHWQISTAMSRRWSTARRSSRCSATKSRARRSCIAATASGQKTPRAPAAWPTA